ncbi:hypothetical protein SAMD00019534_113890, partial [Acytostelium subglobosum LB1]|uniref:hypothetical protein n=1 Tax=Acytostelium subglobosum LB1 TaxID=1410327 RepID=UPI000644C83C
NPMEAIHNERFPTLFINHGAPNMILDKTDKTTIFLTNYQANAAHSKPRAILIVSAHWEAKEFTITTGKHVKPIHDFYGFEELMYQMEYTANTSPELITRLDGLFKHGNITLKHDDKQGLDHGAWTILKMMYPNADVPIVQLSLQHNLDGDLHYRVGQLLQPLRDEGVLIIGSGSTLHNLRLLFSGAATQHEHPIKQFETWIQATLTAPLPDGNGEDRQQRLLKFRSAPSFQLAHPREEHFIPLMVPAGAGNAVTAQLIHCDWRAPSFCLSCFQW